MGIFLASGIKMLPAELPAVITSMLKKAFPDHIPASEK